MPGENHAVGRDRPVARLRAEIERHGKLARRGWRVVLTAASMIGPPSAQAQPSQEELYRVQRVTYGCADPAATRGLTRSSRQADAAWVRRVFSQGHCVLITPKSVWSIVALQGDLALVAYRGFTARPANFYVRSDELMNNLGHAPGDEGESDHQSVDLLPPPMGHPVRESEAAPGGAGGPPPGEVERSDSPIADQNQLLTESESRSERPQPLKLDIKGFHVGMTISEVKSLGQAQGYQCLDNGRSCNVPVEAHSCSGEANISFSFTEFQHKLFLVDYSFCSILTQSRVADAVSAEFGQRPLRIEVNNFVDWDLGNRNSLRLSGAEGTYELSLKSGQVEDEDRQAAEAFRRLGGPPKF